MSFHRPVATASVINVASVPHRSPFRYPGGKTWLVPYVRLWLKSRSPVQLIEPFAGGGIVGLTAVFEDLVKKLTLIEMDANVASVWETILNGHGKWLAERIAAFKVTEDSVKMILTSEERNIRHKAFATIVRNRVQRGGILASGAGFMKSGENGRGLRSRWYPETLRKRILDIVKVRDRIKFVRGDGMQFVERNVRRRRTAFFVDPPYPVAGRRLYKHCDIDHRKLFALMGQCAGDFLMTYDDSAQVRKLILEFGFDCEPVAMKNTHNTRMEELLISRNLNWLRACDLSQKSFLGAEIGIPLS